MHEHLENFKVGDEVVFPHKIMGTWRLVEIDVHAGTIAFVGTQEPDRETPHRRKADWARSMILAEELVPPKSKGLRPN